VFSVRQEQMPKKRRFDELMEAVTFAEAGELDTARSIASELFEDQAWRGERILAVSGARGFPRRMVDDALGMAERLGFGIVAVTVAPALAKLLARLSRARASRGRLTPDAFRERATERGVPFVHAVRSGDPEKVVAEVSRRCRRIAFLLIDPGLAARKRFSGVDVPIYYVAEARERRRA
jgi:hypothetical protein